MAFNYSFRVAVSLAVALLAGVMWTVDVFWGALCTALLPINPEKPDVPLNKNDAFQKVQKRRVQEKR